MYNLTCFGCFVAIPVLATSVYYTADATLQDRPTPCVSGKTHPTTFFGRGGFRDHDVSTPIMITPEKHAIYWLHDFNFERICTEGRNWSISIFHLVMDFVLNLNLSENLVKIKHVKIDGKRFSFFVQLSLIGKSRENESSQTLREKRDMIWIFPCNNFVFDFQRLKNLTKMKRGKDDRSIIQILSLDT